ncbi:DMT family transporter [Methylobacterium nodulans]|uniref:DMT family transporter n=1 Tax=Methylobacterium nodulans TaxID=114616 RepID=UPI0005C212D0|nr:DMT family transporter [Methylobacterium nodulans]
MKAPLSARWIGFLCLAATALGWALNWPAMKFLLREWPPLFARGVAGAAAAFLLTGVAVLYGESLKAPRHVIPRLLFAAFTNVFAWMGFSTLCMKWLDVGEGALLVYTMPIWATLLAWPILGSRPTRRGTGALLLGMAGVSVLLSARGFNLDTGKLLGIGFAFSAAVLFALGTVLNCTPLPLPPITAVAWQVGLGCLPMILIGLVFERPNLGGLNSAGWSVLAYMTLVPMGLCYLAWFATLRRLPPAVASTGMLLVPLIGVLSAAVILGEPLGPRQFVSLALTLGGVTLALQTS